MTLVQVLFAFAVFVQAYGCGPAVPGDYILQNPTFTFKCSPPVSWTWYVGNATSFGYPGQVSSQADAIRTMQNSINNAIYTSANKLGYSTLGMTWTISGYSPEMMQVVDQQQMTAGANYVGTYVPARGAVVQKRVSQVTPATTPITYNLEDYIAQITINVKSNMLYTKSQWQNFADQVFTYLSIYEKVYFRGPVTIS